MPTCPVFTGAKIKSRSGIKVKFSRHTFSYAPDEDKTFEAYYRRYEDIYITDCADWTDAKKSGYFYES